MAQAPRTDRTGSVAVKALEQRYLAAAQAAAAAAAFVTEASEKHLIALLQAKPEARFAALSDAGSVLTSEDRIKLIASLQGQTAPSSAILATTASRWAIFRSRLPYRVVPLTIKAMTGVAVVVLALLAWHRTPEQWVTIVEEAASITRWRLPEGAVMTGAPTTNKRYALLRRDGATGILRAWLPGRGYAEARVPIEDLRSTR